MDSLSSISSWNHPLQRIHLNRGYIPKIINYINCELRFDVDGIPVRSHHPLKVRGEERVSSLTRLARNSSMSNDYGYQLEIVV